MKFKIQTNPTDKTIVLEIYYDFKLDKAYKAKYGQAYDFNKNYRRGELYGKNQEGIENRTTETLDISIPVSITLNVSTTNLYKLNLNIDKVFYPSLGSQVDYKNNETQAHGDAADGPLTDKVALNFSRAFSIE